METPIVEEEKSNVVEEGSNRGNLVTGAILIFLGSLWLLGQFFDLPDIGDLFLPLLGGAFLVWGILTRNSGLLIPGGILSGIGVGSLLQDVLPVSGNTEAGVFLLTFGGGFALITLLSLVFTSDKHYWALVPAAIMGAIGGALFIGGIALEMLEIAGTYWPIILIAIGLYIIFKRR